MTDHVKTLVECSSMGSQPCDMLRSKQEYFTRGSPAEAESFYAFVIMVFY